MYFFVVLILRCTALYSFDFVLINELVNVLILFISFGLEWYMIQLHLFVGALASSSVIWISKTEGSDFKAKVSPRI